MKKGLKVLIAALSLLLAVNARSAFAETLPSNVKLQGDADGIVTLPDEDEDGTTTFLYKNGMLPGDSVERTMKIENKYEAPYTLYLRAERVTPKEENDLLQKIQVKITYKDEVIYEGPVSGEDGMAQDIELGVFQPGDEAELHAVATLDGPSTDEKYMNKESTVDWVFTATSEGAYVVPDNPEPDPTPEPEPSQPSPAPAQSQQVVEPMAPKTGDDSMVMYGSLAAGSLVLLLLTIRKKKVQKEV